MKPRGWILLALAALLTAPGAPHAQERSKCRFQKVVEWQVRSIGRHMAVDGAINGRKIGIVLDTGATSSVLFTASAKRLGLDLREALGARSFGIGGETKAYTTVVDEFKLGEATVRALELRVGGERDPGEGFDLLLGEDFLRNFDLEFDLARDVVRVWQPEGCAGVSLAHWTKEVVGEVGIDAVTDMSRQIAFTVKLNGKPVHAILDSGASTSIVSKHDAEAVGASDAGHVDAAGGMGAKTIETRVGRFASFAIGNEEIADVEIRVADLYQGATYQATGSRIARNAFRNQPMLLGADFLRSHRTLVSHSQRKLYFTYVGGPVFATGRAKPPAGPAPDAQGKAKAE